MSRILVAEDSATQAELLRAILEEAGLEVVLAPDAERALSLLEQTPVDLVISDIVMPGMSGYDLCRRIKALPAHQSFPVVLLSTLREPMDIIRGLECGADSFLTKPYQPDQIVDRVNTILENRESARQGELRHRDRLPRSTLHDHLGEGADLGYAHLDVRGHGPGKSASSSAMRPSWPRPRARSRNTRMCSKAASSSPKRSSAGF